MKKEVCANWRSEMVTTTQRLDLAMLKAGIKTSKQLAELSGMKYNTIMIARTNNTGFQPKNAEKLARVLRCTVEWINGETSSYYQKNVGSTQPCWNCKNAVPEHGRGCNWSRHLEPVDGWTAVESPRINGSYRILDCPEYEKEDVE